METNSEEGPHTIRFHLRKQAVVRQGTVLKISLRNFGTDNFQKEITGIETGHSLINKEKQLERASWKVQPL